MRFAVVDDHALVREGLSHALHVLDAASEVAELADGQGLLAWLEQGHRPDLLLLDLNLPDTDGHALLRQLLQRWPGLRVAVCSASEDPFDMRRAIETGALGYLPKTLPREVMLEAIRLVLAGGTYIPADAFTSAHAPDHHHIEGQLSERQAAVLQCLRQGLPNKQIARLLDISENTVKTHIAHLLKLLGAANRTEAVARARTLPE